MLVLPIDVQWGDCVRRLCCPAATAALLGSSSSSSAECVPDIIRDAAFLKESKYIDSVCVKRIVHFIFLWLESIPAAGVSVYVLEQPTCSLEHNFVINSSLVGKGKKLGY